MRFRYWKKRNGWGLGKALTGGSQLSVVKRIKGRKIGRGRG
jgi:hypothetical protein